ncbi:MAG TPA: hypothetical protein VLZ33_05245 [Dysgonamonadaceae bacterium]|nr:hypothetical protein [Dysgonamonadaceae bacterium]
MKVKSVVPFLKRLFYISIGAQFVFFISVAFKWIEIMPDSTDISITLERYALLVTLISIPGALKLFSVIMKKNKQPEDEKTTNAIYIKAYITRFGILFLVASINILLFAISFKQNFLLCSLVTFTTYLFCYPTANYLKEK